MASRTAQGRNANEAVPGKPRTASLVDPRFDSDSCGVGFVATTGGSASHAIVEHALTALARLAHRGATASDGLSSDGVGLMTGIPREMLLGAAGLTLAAERVLGIGMVFVPAGQHDVKAVVEECLAEHGFEVLGWREVPVETAVLGRIALSAMPGIAQVFVAQQMASADVERRLYLVRKQFERRHEAGEVEGYICSLSTRTLVYKAMCSGALLPRFYPDLAEPEFVSCFAVFHQRYATNTAPSWNRAQPARSLAHNGEINTVWGNRARMAARDATLPDECKPVITHGGTDSTSLDEAVELLAQNGRTLAESIRILLPPAFNARRDSTFLALSRGCGIEPWDGPAAIAFSDGLRGGRGAGPQRAAAEQVCDDRRRADHRGFGGWTARSRSLSDVVHSGTAWDRGRCWSSTSVQGKDLRGRRAARGCSTPSATYAQRCWRRQPFEPVLTDGLYSLLARDELNWHAQRGFGYTREDVKHDPCSRWRRKARTACGR